MDGFDLRWMDGHLAFEPERAGAPRRRTQSLGIADNRERPVDRHQAVSPAGVGNARHREMPKVIPVTLPRPLPVVVGQNQIVRRRGADGSLETSEIELIIAAAEHQRVEPPAGPRDRLDIGYPARGFDQSHNPDRTLPRQGPGWRKDSRCKRERRRWKYSAPTD